MSFTKETIDLSGLNNNQIKSKLSELNIALTPEEGRKIQEEMLGRPASIAELVLFSIQACFGIDALFKNQQSFSA